jgi:lysophospholipase L1-like esterase
MQDIAIQEDFFQGAISIEKGDGFLKPWRLPFDQLELFASPDDTLVTRSEHASGVRLRFETDSTTAGLSFLPLTCDTEDQVRVLDATVDGEIVCSKSVSLGDDSVLFDTLPEGKKVVELWLPHDTPIALTSMILDDHASYGAAADDRLKWVTYGSSLTHCRLANGSSRIWAAIVARRKKLNLTSLGYGGNCCIGGALSPRTFKAAVIGLVQIIREKHIDTPIALISPIGYPPNETTPNLLAHTIEGMRDDVADAHARLTAQGDTNLQYFNGLDLFNVDEIAQYTEDECHPNGDGIELMGEHFIDRILPKLPI